jgi:hypothetical protein
LSCFVGRDFVEQHLQFPFDDDAKLRFRLALLHAEM